MHLHKGGSVIEKRKESELIKQILGFLQIHENAGNIFYYDRLNSGEAFVGDGE